MIAKLKGQYYKFINWIIFSIRDVTWKQFPRVKGVIKIQGWGSVQLGKEVEINSGLWANPVGHGVQTVFSVAKGARVIIGDKVGLSNVLLYAIKEIEVENEVLLGGGVQIIDNDFHSIYYHDRTQRKYLGVRSDKVHIKMGAFIGMNSVILKGVVIGERSVIAANSLVVKPVPPDELWGGNPAKFIRKIQ